MNHISIELTSHYKTMLIKLQALWVSQTQNIDNQDINPFAPREDSTTLNAHCTTVTHDQHYHNLKLTFPKFDGEDPTGTIL